MLFRKVRPQDLRGPLEKPNVWNLHFRKYSNSSGIFTYFRMNWASVAIWPKQSELIPFCYFKTRSCFFKAVVYVVTPMASFQTIVWGSSWRSLLQFWVVVYQPFCWCGGWTRHAYLHIMDHLTMLAMSHWTASHLSLLSVFISLDLSNC